MYFFTNNNQKDNIAKYCFDVSKIILAILVITPIVKDGLENTYLAFEGITLVLFFFFAGYLLDGKEV
ncbi:hypothetical protein MNB_SUP05-SYMBIONT-5-1270 [hydrothermal vent metagenome]|uniref:Uncharacterized protein n=1 Tax=hydrothermal vent metagenome TaxID=652676 RepID=A0A1W1E272_9ZZZZ